MDERRRSASYEWSCEGHGWRSMLEGERVDYWINRARERARSSEVMLSELEREDAARSSGVPAATPTTLCSCQG